MKMIAFCLLACLSGLAESAQYPTYGYEEVNVSKAAIRLLASNKTFDGDTLSCAGLTRIELQYSTKDFKKYDKISVGYLIQGSATGGPFMFFEGKAQVAGAAAKPWLAYPVYHPGEEIRTEVAGNTMAAFGGGWCKGAEGKITKVRFEMTGFVKTGVSLSGRTQYGPPVMLGRRTLTIRADGSAR